MWAPVTSCIAVMLHPPLPIILETTEAGTDNFFDLKMKTTHELMKSNVFEKMSR